jgi:protein tyrosine/serine phosphatase
MVKRWWTALLVGVIAVLLFGLAPYLTFRYVYTHAKRLREVVPGRVYRSGQMTAEGFTEAITRLKIRTVLNVQDDFPDPDLYQSFWTNRTVKESELCRRLGVRYVQISPDLISRKADREQRPEAIDQFLALMDREDTYPVLIHCKAGLHRTGCLVAVYRMEYQGWSNLQAFRELKANGFGPWACTSSNEYVRQYVLRYQPGRRRPGYAPPESARRAGGPGGGTDQ